MLILMHIYIYIYIYIKNEGTGSRAQGSGVPEFQAMAPGRQAQLNKLNIATIVERLAKEPEMAVAVLKVCQPVPQIAP